MAVRIYNIVVNFRIASYEFESISMSDLTSVGKTVSASSSFHYDSAWGELNMEIQLAWIEEIPFSSDSLRTTN